jgi:hypothetical protein
MIYKKSNIYTKPEIEFYVTPVEQGFSATAGGDDGNKDNDFEYGDGGDAW